MAGALEYNQLTGKVLVFRILEGIPAQGSDFEAFSQVP